MKDKKREFVEMYFGGGVVVTGLCLAVVAFSVMEFVLQ